MTEFEKSLRAALNAHCCENGSDTPDFVLAEYLISCLNAFDNAVQDRRRWYNSGGGPKGRGLGDCT